MFQPLRFHFEPFSEDHHAIAVGIVVWLKSCLVVVMLEIKSACRLIVGQGRGFDQKLASVLASNIFLKMMQQSSAYAARLSAGHSPAQAREILTERERRLERILLLTRLAEGCPVAELEPAGRAAAQVAAEDGLADRQALAAGRVVLTQPGRLLADAVIRELTG